MTDWVSRGGGEETEKWKSETISSAFKQEWCWSTILKYRTLSSGQLQLRRIWRKSASYWWDLLLWQTHKVCKVNLSCLANWFSETVFGVLFVAVQQMALRKIDFHKLLVCHPGKPQQMYIWLDLKHPLWVHDTLLFLKLLIIFNWCSTMVTETLVCSGGGWQAGVVGRKKAIWFAVTLTNALTTLKNAFTKLHAFANALKPSHPTAKWMTWVGLLLQYYTL